MKTKIQVLQIASHSKPFQDRAEVWDGKRLIGKAFRNLRGVPWSLKLWLSDGGKPLPLTVMMTFRSLADIKTFVASRTVVLAYHDFSHNPNLLWI